MGVELSIFMHLLVIFGFVLLAVSIPLFLLFLYGMHKE